MPFHCQKKALYESGTFLPWEDEKQENIERIALLYSPLPEFDGSGADDILTHTLTATSKQQQDDRKKKKRRRGKEESGKKPLAVVQSERSPDSLIDSYNADNPLSESDCNNFIASLFGGEGATVRTFMDIDRKSRTTEKRPDGTWIYEDIVPPKEADRSDHLFEDGVFHIYTDEYGSVNKETELFVPKGASFVKPTRKTKGEYKSEGEWKNEFVFNLSGAYKGVSIYFVHVGGTNGGSYQGANLGEEFINKKNELIGKTNAAGSTQIGYIGGLGGSNDHVNGIYRHTHIVVKLNGVRTDPRKVFCGWK